jgi:ankyrin repeat protein
MNRYFPGFAVLIVALAAPVFAAGGGTVADAAMKGDFTSVRALLGRKADVNAPLADGSTALHWAAHWDDVAAADVLIKAGANPAASSRLGATPMSVAAENGSAAMIARLLAAGVDANATFLADSETALMLAARAGSADGVTLLLDAGANIEARDSLRETTALSWAAENRHPAVVALLLSRGADPKAASKVVIPKGRNANADADEIDLSPLPANANAKGGLNALMVATREGSLDIMKMLLDGGADINQQAGNGSTALLVAVQNGNAATAKLLLERGADVNIANGKGWTPLFLAVKARTRERGTVPSPVIDPIAMMDVIKVIVDKGANVNAQLKGNTDSYGATTWLVEAGATALLRASFCGDLEVMKLLMAHGADPLITTNDGTTTLMALAGVGYGDGFTSDFGPPEQSVEAMKLLLDAGVPVNAMTKEKITALHGAAHKNFVLGIQYLVDHGADLTMRSQRASNFEHKGTVGNTVLDWATGVQVNMQSASYKKEAVELVTRLMQERNIPVEGLSTTKGGRGTTTVK